MNFTIVNNSNKKNDVWPEEEKQIMKLKNSKQGMIQE